MNSGIAMTRPYPTILIVADHFANLGVLNNLKNLAYRVEMAQHGDEGLQRAAFIKPDLILLDVVVPEMEGFKTCQSLKTHPELTDIPVIFMSESIEIDIKITGFKLGGADYLNKPIIFDELVSKIETYVSLGRMRWQLEQSTLQIKQLQTYQQELEQKLAIHRTELNISYGIFQDEVDALKQPTQRMELLDFALNLGNEAVFLIDEQARFHYVNKEASRSLGYSCEELLSMGVCDIDPLFNMVKWSEFWRDVQVAKHLILESSHRTKTGLVFPVEVYANHFEYSGRAYNLALVRNIATRKQLEALDALRLHIFEKLAQGEALNEILDLIVLYIEQALPDSLGSIMLVDSNGKNLFSASALSLPIDYTAATEGLPIDNGVGSCGTAAWSGKTVIVEDISTHPYWAPYKHIALQADLRACWSEPIFDSTGKVLGTFGIYHRQVQRPSQADLELLRLASHFAAIAIERWQIAERLRVSEREFRTLAENAPDNIVRYDREARTLYMNPVLERTLGLTREQAEGKRPVDLFPDIPAMQLYQQFLEQVIASGEPVEFELDSEAFGNSRPLYEWVRMAPELDNQGIIVGAIVISRDNTEQKRLNRELRAISNCNQTLMRAADEQTLLNDICSIICEDAGYSLAWVGYLENYGAKSLRPVAWAGAETASFETAMLPQAGSEPGQANCKTTMYWDDSFNIPDCTLISERQLQNGHRSCITLPLKNESGYIFGLLNIYSTSLKTFANEEVRLLEELSGDLAFGITVLRARIEQDRQQQWLGLLEHVLNHTHEAVYLLVDINGSFIYVNEEACLGLNYSREELLNMGLRDIDPDFSLLETPAWFDEIQTKGYITLERWHMRRDGQLFPVEVLTTFVDYQGQNLAISLVRDITDRKHAEKKLRISEERLRLTLEVAQIAIFDWNVAEDQFIVSPTYYTMLGYEPEAGYGNRELWLERVHPDDRAYVELKIQQVLAKEFNEYSYEARIRHADGQYRWLGVKAFSIEFNEFGNVVRILGIRMDITERYKAEEQLRIAATAFEAQEGIIITDASMLILRVNRAFTEITGYAPDDVVGRNPKILASDKYDRMFYASITKSMQIDASWQGEILSRRKDGEIFPVWLNITAVKNELGVMTHYVGMMVDITERKTAERAIEQLAFFDPLTNLPNRRLLKDRLQQSLCGNSRSQNMSALLFIDLDNFKLLNDTCGHHMGDQLLIDVAGRLSACVREGDTISRLGGDEFIVMLENLSENALDASVQAYMVGEKILDELNRPYTIAGIECHSTPSIGVTLFGDTENSVEELLKQADIAMYEAKSAGRNTLRFFDPDMQTALAQKANMEAELRTGVQEGQFVLHYQAQADGDRGIVSAEVLLRWKHPERGIVSPAQFIPLAEETGLILPIGLWVLQTACKQLKSWMSHPRTSALHLAINVSVRQFRQADFVDQVRQVLKDTGAPPKQLKLELTESLVLDDIEDSINKMRTLRQLGVSFSIDDFGTGYSSLSYLTRLPLDQLKIDQSFIRHLPDNANDALVAQTIITLANSLGLNVIAEGVETEVQRQFLAKHGCPTYQGYLLSKPVPLADFEVLLDSKLSVQNKD